MFYLRLKQPTTIYNATRVQVQDQDIPAAIEAI